MSLRTRTALLGFACVLGAMALSACSKEPPAAPPQTAEQAAASAAEAQGDAKWNAFADSFIEDYFKAQPFFAVYSGRHEFDGQMPDLTKAGFEKEIARLHKWRDDAEKFDTAALNEQQKFQREYLLGVVNGDLFWQERAQFPFKNPAYYINNIDPNVYLSREYAPLEKRMQAYIGYARAIPGIAAAIKQNIKTPMPKSYVQRGVDGFGGYADFYKKDVAAVFASIKDEQLQKDFAEANAGAVKAMTDLKAWFESNRKSATNDFALGEALFSEMLKQTERVETPIAELAAAGKADLDRNIKALTTACTQYAPNASIRECIDKMDAKKPTVSPVERGREQLKELHTFLEQKQIVTIPGPEEALVEEAPPYNRANFAYIVIPGPYEKGLPSTYFISPPDPTWSKAEQAAYIPGEANLLFTSVHEVWPGHFLQFLHSNRNASKLQSLWVGYAFAEGWAHYTEEMMWDAGLGNGDPETHIGQISNALLRDVRFLSAVGMHAQGMTLQESEKMFREQAFADPGTARQQAARGTYDPAYLNYTMGKLMIRKLRNDWIARQGRASADAPAGTPEQWKLFHDKFLSYGGPAIPLIRKEMLGDASGAL